MRTKASEAIRRWRTESLNASVMSKKYQRWIAVCGVCIIVAAITAVATGCVSMQTHFPIAKDTRLAPIDAVTRMPIQEADIFHFTLLEANGCVPFAESCWRDVRYQYSGHEQMPYLVPSPRYRTVGFNFLLWVRRPARCYTAVAIYKRGYLTTLWVPGHPIEVPMTKTADSNMSDHGTGEGEIDWLLEWTCLSMPDRARFYWTREDALLGDARTLERSVSTLGDFRKVVGFAIAEYDALRKSNAASDPKLEHRLSEKLKGLSELIGRN